LLPARWQNFHGRPPLQSVDGYRTAQRRRISFFFRLHGTVAKRRCTFDYASRIKTARSCVTWTVPGTTTPDCCHTTGYRSLPRTPPSYPSVRIVTVGWWNFNKHTAERHSRQRQHLVDGHATAPGWYLTLTWYVIRSVLTVPGTGFFLHHRLRSLLPQLPYTRVGALGAGQPLPAARDTTTYLLLDWNGPC